MSDQGFLCDGIRPAGSGLELGKLLGRVGGNLGISVERIRMLSGKVEWSPHGSRALWEGKAFVPSAFIWGNRQGVFWRLQSQEVPELGPGLNPPLTIWRDVSFRAHRESFLGLLTRMWEPEPPVEQLTTLPERGILDQPHQVRAGLGWYCFTSVVLFLRKEKGKLLNSSKLQEMGVIMVCNFP